MEGLKIYTPEDIRALVNIREGETKLGECVQFILSLEELETSSAAFVLIGIPEDIGVRANHGIAGASSAWQPALKAILNIQSNRFLQGSELLVLGHFIFNDPEVLEIGALQQKVEQIDTIVYELIERIVAAGKTPIAIGGGHNNAYPIIKGTSLAKQRAIHVINIDAHADLRPATGRHSGNGFSYALKHNYLGKYGIFGLHQNYNNEAILREIDSNPDIYTIFFEEVLTNPNFKIQYWKELAENFESPGLEIDLDSIENVLSSAASPSGFNLNLIRDILLTSTKKYAYLHICEGAVAMSDGRTDQQTAKVIAYLVTDFLKNQK
ncbi:arginase [Pedobacter frigoris]|uniref:Arginase n=2 Tax=Pedobacter frigoris TaxID=2571272 RepID=A0A4U1CHC2_9SPHI|nr:arginase [Pedobacter frigoris]